MSENRKKYVYVLKNILKDGISLGDIKNTIDDKERPFFNMLMMTALRQLTFIKTEILPQFIKKKISNKQQILEYLLFLAVTELLFLDTPDYAVINSYVEIAKKETDKFGANFVNAVLRNVLRNKEDLLSKRKAGYFSADFIKILKQDYAPLLIREMEDMVSIEAPLDLTLKQNMTLKADDGIMLFGNTLRLPANTKVSEIPDYKEGFWWVQDAASSLVVKCLPNLENKKVLDICAAPGGKTAQLLDKGAIVTAVDISEKRLQRLKENIDRLKLANNLTIVCSDALQFQAKEKFDVILVDAPCSATGTYRRHPEIMNIKTLKDVKSQAALQKQILEHVIELLKPQGILAYATCSLSKLEGEIQIKNFLLNHPDFCILPINLKESEPMQTKEGYLRILPSYLKDISGIDGFFIAILQRKI